MAQENILKVTAVPPGSSVIREISCLESEVANLIVYLTRRGYDDIRVFETVTAVRQRGAEVW